MKGAQDTIDTLQARLTQLEAGSQRSAKIQAALYAIADAASASTDLPAFYAALHATVGQLMYARNFFIATLDRESGMISWPYYVDEHDTGPAPMPLAGDQRTVSAYVMRTSKTFHHRSDEAARLMERDEVHVVGTDNTDGVFVPLKDGNEAIGALAVQSYTPGIEYTEEDVRLLTFVAQHIATALTRARALEDTRQRNAELAIINSVQAGLAQELSLQGIYDLVGDRLLEIFQVHTVSIVSYDPTAGDLTDRYAYEKGDRTLVGGSIPLFGFRKHVVETRQSMVINRDILALARQYGNPTLVGATPKSAVFVPMLAGDRVTGVVSLQDMDRENAFSPADVSLLETVTAAMSVALENARLYDETQRLLQQSQQRAAELQIINSVQQGLASKLDMQAIYDLVGEKIREIFGADTAYIAVFDEAARVFEFPFYVDAGQRVETTPLPLGDGLTSRVLATREPLLLNSNEDLKQHGADQVMRQVPSDPGGEDLNQSYLGVPVWHGERVGAVVSIQSHRPHAFGEDETRFLSTLANSMGAALENARLFDQLQASNREISEALEQQTANSEILRVIAASPTDIQPVLDAVAQNAARLCNSYDAGIARVEADRIRVVAHWGPVPVPPDQIDPGLPLTAETVTGRAILEARSIHVEDVRSGEGEPYPLSRESSQVTGQRTLLATPLLREGRAIGAIILRRQQVDPFTEKQAALLRVFADQAAIAIENVRLFGETKRLLSEAEQRAAELAIINSVQAGLASKQEMQAIYDLVGDKLHQTFSEAQVVDILTYDNATGMLHPRYVLEKGRRFEVQPWPAAGFRKHVIETGDPLLINRDVPRLSVEYGNPKVILGEPTKSLLFVPMKTGTQVTGVISLQHVDREDAFSAADLRLLQTLAGSMSVALENARLFDETQRLLQETEQRAAELAIINSVQQGLASKLDLQSIYELVCERIRETFGAETAYIAILDPERKEFRVPYYVDQGEHLPGRRLVRRDAVIPLGQGLTSKIYKTGQPLLLRTRDEQEGALRHQYSDASQDLNESFLGVPIMAGGAVTGVLSVQSHRQSAYGAGHAQLLSTLAGSMSAALENARLFDETQRRSKEISEALERQTATSEILRIIAQSPADLQPVLDAVAETAARLCDTYDAQIVRREGDLLRVAGHWGPLDITEPGNNGFPLDRNSVTGRAILEQRVLHVEDVLALPDSEYPLSKEFSRSMGQRTLLAVPLIEAGDAIGAIIAPRLEVRPFSEQQIALLRTFADQAVIAIRNARLFEQVQRRTEEISEALEQQTATSDILRVMAEWPADVQPVLEVIADHAAKLCDGVFTAVYRTDGQQVFEAAARDFTDEGLKLHASEYPRPLKMDSSLSSRAILTGQSIHIPDFESAPEVPDVARRYSAALGMRSVYFEPMMKEGKAIGAIAVGRRSAGPFSAKHIELLRTFAHQAVIAIENVRLFNESARLLKQTEERAAELAAVNTVSQALVAETDLDRTISLIGDQIRATFAADIVYVALVDPQTNLIAFPYQHGQELSPMRLGEGITSKIIESGQPILINQELDHRIGELGKQRMGKEARSYLGVPITAGGEPIGVISVQSTQQENAFTEDDARLLSTIAANAGAAIRAARLHAETGRRAQEMATLAEIGNEIAATRELEPVLERIAAHAAEIMRVRDIAILLRDADGEAFHNEVALGRYSEQMKALVIRPGIGVAGSILAGGVAELVNDSEHDPRRITIPGTPDFEEDPECLMGAPLVSRGEVIGGIMVWRLRRDGLFTQNELDFLVSVGRQTTIAIESARLYLETRRRANEMSALAEVGREISASLDSAVVLERIAERARGLLQAENSAVYLPEPNGTSMKAIAAFGDAAPALKTVTITVGAGIIGTLAQQGEAAVINDVAHDPRGIAVAGMNEPETERMMVAPLTRGDQVTGMLVVWRTTATFTEADLNFLVGLARQASIALENARLFAEVRAEKQYSETLVRNVPAAIIGIDQDANVSSWNPAAEKLFGYSLEEALGNPIDDLIARDPEIRDEALQYSDEARSGKEFRTITRRSRKDGTLVDVELSAVPIRHGDDHLEHIGIFHDITELQRARREAVAANEAKSAFLATMSHEIRTPMNAVIGMSGLLMDTPLSAEQRDYAETIRSSGDALLAIINDILDFSKIEAGRMELERQPFDLRECVESAVDLVAGRANEKGLDLAYLIEDDVPPGIRGDVTRLRQILLNLVSNAVKFTEKGEVVIHVRRDPHPDRLLFTVRDTGIGIPRNRMGRLFESFSQADSSTTRKFGGTGLGLAISKRLAEMMGGAMWAESGGAGKGSTFSFTLQAPSAGVAPRKAARDLQVLQPSLARKRVLIVDDNDTNRRILMRQTEKWGMSPREFGTPRDALRWLKTGQQVDLAIFDLQMPEMDGLTLVREVRKLKRRAQLPIILLTSLGRKEPGAEELGVAAYLMKPLKPSGLFDALAAIFAKGRIAARAETRQATFDASLAEAHPLRILLAEDNAVNQKLALRLLEQMGYRADIASNGIEAVESVQRQDYDVVLMDVQMPEMDGLDATRRIRKLPHLVQPRIVAMTANAMEGDREMCLQAGMDDYVSKPVRVGELQDALRRTPSAQARVPGKRAPRSRKGGGRPAAKSAPKRSATTKKVAARRKSPRGRKAR